MEITSVSNSAKRNVERPKRELILANGRKDLLFDWLIDFHPENQCKSIVPRPDVVIDAESCTQTPDASENDEESFHSLLDRLQGPVIWPPSCGASYQKKNVTY